MKFSDLKKEQKLGIVSTILFYFISSIIFAINTLYFVIILIKSYEDGGISISVCLGMIGLILLGYMSLIDIVARMSKSIFHPETKYEYEYKKKEKALYKMYPQDIAELKLEEWECESDLKEIKLNIKRLSK